MNIFDLPTGIPKCSIDLGKPNSNARNIKKKTYLAMQRHRNMNTPSKKNTHCVRPGLGSRPLVNGNFCSSGPLCYFSIAAKDFM